MNDLQLLRYSRHLFLDEIDLLNQEKFLNSTVLIVGCGGLGNACATFLALSGIGHLILVDHDQVELSNLQRQFCFDQTSLHQSKSQQLAYALEKKNSDVQFTIINEQFSNEIMEKYSAKIDIIVDCTDNFQTHYKINHFSHKYRIPMVYGAANGFYGQITSFNAKDQNSPCLACLFNPKEHQFEEINCATNGVFSPLVGVIGTYQAAETLKIIGKFGRPLFGQLQQINLLTTESYSIKYGVNSLCPCCQL